MHMFLYIPFNMQAQSLCVEHEQERGGCPREGMSGGSEIPPHTHLSLCLCAQRRIKQMEGPV